MADFICDCECVYKKDKECQLNLNRFNSQLVMPGYCPKIIVKKSHIRYEAEI
jgi:hypothetical protein